MRLHTTVLRVVVVSIVLAALPAWPVAAQQYVAGTVVEGGASTPVGGAMVVVLDGERVVAQALTGLRGTFRITVPRPGRYELRVDRIGYESTHTEPFDLTEGATVVRQVASRVQAVTLPGLSVAGEERCEVRPEGAATAVLWEEARKALAAAAWTRERGTYRFAWTRFLRELSPDGRRVLSEQRSMRSELSAQPFTSVEPETLARDGFVFDRGDSIVYAAPDARVLLSDEFLDTHCFSLEERVASGEQLVGLRFQPLRGSRLADVEGVLWLGRQTLRLRSVEYRYVNLPWRISRHSAGGEVYYRGLPNGTWIVNEWTIRMLRLSETRSPSGEVLGHEVLGYMSEGSIVNVVATATGEVVDRETGLGELRGVVADSAGRPVGGALVWIQGTDFRTETRADGRFAFAGVGAGVWSVGASNPALERIGHAGTFQNADVQRGSVSEVRLDLPSVRAAALALCEDGEVAEDTGVLVGRVVGADGRPVRGAAVRVLWTAAGLQELVGEDSDDSGRFDLCGVPRAVRVRAWATLADLESAVVQLPATREDVVELDLTLVGAQSSAAAASLPPAADEEETWLASKGFPLRGEGALLHQRRRDLEGRSLESLEKILTQVPRVEAKRLVTGRTEYRLHALEGWRGDPESSLSCPLEFYLNGSLVRANTPIILAQYGEAAGRAFDLTPLDLDLWLRPRDVTAVEVFDAADAPVNAPGGCGAALFWVRRLDHLQDPEFTGSLSGRVLRMSDNQPVQGVRVTVSPGGLERRTDSFGRFDFGWLPAARYRVDVAAPGATFTNEVLLRAGGRAEVSVQVEPPSGLGPEAIGTLRDSESGAPVSGASLELLTEDGRDVVARTISSASGAFRLSAARAGRYRVRASRIGIDTLTHGPVELEEGATVTLVLATKGRAIALPAIDVEVAARVRLLEEEGFYERRSGGAGIYMSPEELSRLNPIQTLDVFRTVPGLVLLLQDTGSTVVMTIAGLLYEQRRPPTRPGERTCLPMIYVDGGVVQTGGRDTGIGIFDLTSIPASHLLAVEVFRGPAETPARFTGPFASCGIIAIWTTQRLPPPQVP